jgi:PEGA domain
MIRRMRSRSMIWAGLIVAGVAIEATAHAQPAKENELPPELAPKPARDEPPPPAVTPPPPPPAPAPPPPSPTDPKAKAEARKLIDGGDQFLKRGDYLEKHNKHPQAVDQYERALAAYQKAFDLVANPQVYFAIAGAEEKLGRWLPAALHYRKLLAEAADMKPALRDAATARLDSVKQNLGQLTLTVTPDGAHVSLDGKDLGTTPLPEPLLVAPGEYTLGFTADGFTPMEQKVTLEAGSESERTFALQPIPVVVEKPRAPPPPPPPPPPPVSKVPLYAGAGATAAFTAVAVVTGILAIGRHDVYTDAATAPADRDAARTAGKRDALICDLSIAGALVAGGFTAYWYVKQYKPKVRAREQATPPDEAALPRWWIEPLVAADGGGMAVGGRF